MFAAIPNSNKALKHRTLNHKTLRLLLSNSYRKSPNVLASSRACMHAWTDIHLSTYIYDKTHLQTLPPGVSGPYMKIQIHDTCARALSEKLLTTTEHRNYEAVLAWLVVLTLNQRSSPLLGLLRNSQA